MADSLRGRFVWHEMLATDPKAAATFYKDIVGWKPQPYDKDPAYTLLMSGNRPRAGVMRMPQEAKSMGAQPSWISYIGTPDVDATARQAVELGGKVQRPPSDIPEIGRFAILQDPQGAIFAAFTPLQGPPGDSKPALGDFSWHELATTDWPSALQFYQRLFGWEKTESMEMGPGNTYQMFGWKGNTLGGMFNKAANMPGPPSWLPYTLVPDSKKVAATVKKLGAKVVNGPMEVAGGDWITQGIDLQGAMFAVHSKKASTAAASTPPKKSVAAKPKARKKLKPTAKSGSKKRSKAPSRRAKPARRGARKTGRRR